jgi:tryptase gamma 1
MPHHKRRKARQGRRQLPRRGRVVWEDADSMGSAPAPQSTFPWMAGLFMLIPSSATGEALFMCAGAVLTPNIIVTAAHCFTGNANNPDLWFARVGDNYILKPDENEQTFRVKKIIKHSLFDPLRDDGGDGRNDIAILVLQGHNSKNRSPKRQSRKESGLKKNSNKRNGLIAFSKDVRPICIPPQQDYHVYKLKRHHCEIAGWGMTEYNNSASYPDSIRAARITVGNIPDRYCDYLYKRNVKETGKFCAGGKVDACQEDSGGPLVCKLEDGKYHFIGIVSSGKGCGVYPGLYTEVSRYIDWLAYWVSKESIA